MTFRRRLNFDTCLVGAALMAPLSSALSAEPPRPHHSPKLIVVNDDGFSHFYSGRYRSAEDLRREMLSYRDTPVAVMEWCVVAGSRSNYPSTVTELFGERQA